MDHRARAQEEQSFEEPVAHEVEDRRGPRPHAQRREHVTELGDRGVGQDPLDVRLGEGDRGGQYRGEDADRGHDDHHSGRGAEDGVAAGHEVDAGVDHRGGMDQGGDRRGAFHCVRQPDVERELGALADGPAEEQQRDDGDPGRREPAAFDQLEDGLHVESSELRPDGHDREGEAHVADSVDQEGLLGCHGRGAPWVPEADQEVAAQAHQLPAGEDEQEVVG